MKKITFTLLSFFLVALGFAQQERNCATMLHLEAQKALSPDLQQRMDAIESYTSQKILSNQGAKVEGEIITIPVVVHIVYNTSIQNISDAQIASQMEVLNEDFRRTNSDADDTWSQATDTQIEFALATVDPDGNATTGITRTYTTETSFEFDGNPVKSTSSGGIDPWDTSEYLNMWVCPLFELLGYATFPGDDADIDGVVMGTQFFGSSDKGDDFYLSAPYDKGRTTTHEVGHYLNLRHIWGDGGCGVDDFVDDTPLSDASNGGCNESHISCGSLDMVQNYMDYTDDDCMNLFTEGQKDRMRAVLETGGIRRNLALSDKFGEGDDDSTTDDDDDNDDDDTDTDTELTYCDSEGSDSSYEWIDYVSFGGFTNSTGDDGGYEDYTSTSASVAPGTTYSLVFSAGFSNSSYTEYWLVWIDYDQDGTFDDDEAVASGSSSSSGNLTADVTIPSTAETGTTTMRVSMKYNSEQTACETFSYGEVEDYSVTISNSARTFDTSSVDLSSEILGNEVSLDLVSFPNPATDFVTIKLNSRNTLDSSFKISDLSGKLVLAGELNDEAINVSELTSGLYLMEVFDGQKTLYTKVIKE